MTKSAEIFELGWLLWLDGIERLDTIILEIRHGQINLIHALRMQELYKPLRFEEDYLWGRFTAKDGPESWHKLLAEPTTVKQIEELATSWIVPYPRLRHTIRSTVAPEDDDATADHCQTDQRRTIVRELTESIGKAVQHGHWPPDVRRLYHALRSLQTLKRIILRDKLILCRWGIKAFAGKPRPSADGRIARDEEMTLGRFLMVRAAVLAEAHRHIQTLGDLKAQFDSALDLGIQDHPKPMTSRRREQGLYSGYLAERVRDLTDLVEHFLWHSKSGGPFRGENFNHRWSHSATSCASVLEGIGTAENIDLVNTSFWMPDRPDLQAIIAHEVAHNVVHHAFGDLEPHLLRDAEGAFPRLLRLLSTALDSFRMRRTALGDPRYAHDHALKELACDLLAATVSGPAYLFALIQEIMGMDLDCMFRSPRQDIDFDLADHWLDDGWAQLELPGFEWYYRLRMVCAWTKGAFKDPLSERLVVAAERLCAILLDTISRLGPKGVENHVGRWRLMADSMVRAIKHSDALGAVKTWGERQRGFARVPDDHLMPLGELFPSAAKPLTDLTTQTIRNLMLEMKRCRFPAIRDWAAFNDQYGLGQDGHRHLFVHLHEVPWQAALLRARDFLHVKEGTMHTADGEWLAEMHEDGAPGRELYQLALEAFYWHQADPSDPMTVVGFREDPEYRQSGEMTDAPKSFSCSKMDTCKILNPE
jgi:hypothetical protein